MKINQEMERSSGVLMHLSSLPGPYGIGTLGREAYSFVNKISEAGFTYWQILPLNAISREISPYSAVSSFAGNSLFIDPELLQAQGLLKQDDLQDFKYRGINSLKADYDFAAKNSKEYLKLAFSNLENKAELENFVQAEKTWLFDYASFVLLSEKYGETWQEWPDPARDRDKKFIDEFISKNLYEFQLICFAQWQFYKQWFSLKKYANSKDVKIIGDMPIYPGMKSADVWSNPEQFLLDKDKQALEISGFPAWEPDEEGQLWGNPIYDWKYMKNDGYSWWLKRLQKALSLVDFLRIDHFRGLVNYFSVPADIASTRFGRWKQGPGMDFFRNLKAKLGRLNIIAEDLGGEDDPEVVAVMQETGFPGMQVLQNDLGPGPNSQRLPYTYKRNKVCYSSTHDSSTLAGWFKKQDRETRNFALEYANESLDANLEEAVQALIKLTWASSCNLAIAQIQDFLYLDDTRAMNQPGTVNDFNWRFRISCEELNNLDIKWIAKINQIYQR